MFTAQWRSESKFRFVKALKMRNVTTGKKKYSKPIILKTIAQMINKYTKIKKKNTVWINHYFFFNKVSHSNLVVKQGKFAFSHQINEFFKIKSCKL